MGKTISTQGDMKDLSLKQILAFIKGTKRFSSEEQQDQHSKRCIQELLPMGPWWPERLEWVQFINNCHLPPSTYIHASFRVI